MLGGLSWGIYNFFFKIFFSTHLCSSFSFLTCRLISAEWDGFTTGNFGLVDKVAIYFIETPSTSLVWSRHGAFISIFYVISIFIQIHKKIPNVIFVFVLAIKKIMYKWSEKCKYVLAKVSLTFSLQKFNWI